MQFTFEDTLRREILPDLEQGRPNWDRPHTEAVVKHAKAILFQHPELDVDPATLVVAAYAHDWGYMELFDQDEPAQFDEVKNAKKAHMQIGAEKLEQLLQLSAFDELSKQQKQRAVHLVRVHDKLNALRTDDELVLMEADTLGALDAGVENSTFDADSSRRYLSAVERIRRPLFITEYGIARYDELMQRYREQMRIAK